VFLHPANAFFLLSTKRKFIGVKTRCIARSIVPPGTTSGLARDMDDSCSMASRQGLSKLRGLAKRITTMLSSAIGIVRAMKGLPL
jgi:hypothetical protein